MTVIRVSVVAFHMAPETTEQGDFIQLWDRSRESPYEDGYGFALIVAPFYFIDDTDEESLPISPSSRASLTFRVMKECISILQSKNGHSRSD